VRKLISNVLRNPDLNEHFTLGATAVRVELVSLLCERSSIISSTARSISQSDWKLFFEDLRSTIFQAVPITTQHNEARPASSSSEAIITTSTTSITNADNSSEASDRANANISIVALPKKGRKNFDLSLLDRDGLIALIHSQSNLIQDLHAKLCSSRKEISNDKRNKIHPELTDDDSKLASVEELFMVKYSGKNSNRFLNK